MTFQYSLVVKGIFKTFKPKINFIAHNYAKCEMYWADITKKCKSSGKFCGKCFRDNGNTFVKDI